MLHSLRLFDFEKAITEINRVSKQAYVVVESYRNENELVNLQCWATVCGVFLMLMSGYIFLKNLTTKVTTNLCSLNKN